ncbi:MAG: sulfite exporter TauE/SafE family protein [Phycisphaerales bacterium JB059]
MEPTPTMLGVLGGVLAASLLGSGHCAGMCGAIMAFAVGAGESDVRSRWKAHLAYHLGRLVMYTMVGVAAGALGAAVNVGGDAVGLQRIAALVAGSLMVVAGCSLLVRRTGRGFHLPTPKRWQRALERAHRFAFSMPPARRALLIGLLTPMLPCAWLYLFALVAAGTGTPVMGGLVMGVFAVGTMPILALLGAGVQTLLIPLRARLPSLTALLVIASGLFTLLGRATLPSFVTTDMAAAAPASVGESLQRVRQISPHDLPCCNPQGAEIGG